MALSKGTMVLLILAFFMVAIHQVSCSCSDVRLSRGRNFHRFENSGTFLLCVESLVEEERRVFLFFRNRIGLSALQYKKDIDFPNHNFTAEPYFNFTIQQREERCFQIEIIDDNVTEEAHKYLFYTLGVYNRLSANCYEGRIRIEDNDNVYFSASQSSNVKENIGSVTPCVSSRAEVELRAFFYSNAFGTTYREDVVIFYHNFTADPYFNFTVQPGDQHCFEIFIVDDIIAENEYEHVNYDIGVYTPIPFHRWSGRIRIQDDEGFRFEEDQYYVDEDVGTVNVCTTYKGENVPQTLEAKINLNQNGFYLVNSHGQGDLLFSPRNITLTIGDRRCFDIVIVDDDLSEYGEEFWLDIALRNGSFHSYYRDSVRIFVRDNDG